MSVALAGVELPPVITVDGMSFGTQPLISGEDIQNRVDEMGQNLAARYEERGAVHVITVMSGALHFASDLRRSMQSHSQGLRMTSDQVSISSYTGMQSSGVLHFQSAPIRPIEGMHVLVAEDILDSGLTLDWFARYLRGQEPASVEVAVAINKDNPKRRPGLLGQTALHSGFTIPNEFVVGYGLDYEQQFRDLAGVHVLSKMPPSE